MAVEFSPETLKKVDEIISRYPKKEAAMIPVLCLAQEEFGYLSQDAIEYVAEIMRLSPARIYGVVTFYTMLHRKPIGKYHLQVCRTLPCALLGSERVTAFLKARLGIEVGETTPDGRFTLSEAECLASCGTGPMIQINEDYYENLTEKTVEEILQSLK